MLPSSASSEDRPGARSSRGGALAGRALAGRVLPSGLGRLLGLWVGLWGGLWASTATAAPAAPAAAEEAPRPSARLGFGGEIRASGSVHQSAASFALSGDYAWRRAALAVGVELNPYFGVGPGDALPGALHVFAAGEHRVPIGRLTLRQRIGVGPAILLADTLGQARGSVGIFLEGVPLGLEIQTKVQRLAVVLEAFSLALSAPSLRASEAGDPPLFRYQYRASVGVRF
ncbi:MAG: hypothetical protein H6711_30720 [Myxococcales bacterium]|nr:hypothetical protein [Myxococcales bacterium]